MARVGGRNTVFAWFVGIVCTAVVVALAVLAAPVFPAATGWVAGAVGQVQRAIDPDAAAPVDAAEPADAPADSGDTGLPTQCRDLYDNAMWATLRFTEGAELTASVDAPGFDAPALVEALSPQVMMTCRWTSDAGTVSTTIATVPTDAGAIAAASLPSSGFECAAHAGRMLCTRTDGELLETLEAAAGIWVSTSQDAWHPTAYAARVADGVWASAD
ncbi:hypothetical protein AB3M83_13065 [Microbacterium sp. 179-B 1A2 NHS]|uniref:hypothetical protein n=1 Tax=Microbacterium sp. 179-B 1A2 NHS TaxID=3142383 RepID=UPI0039A0F3C3